ncbi:MAG: hypothetical protein Q9217_003610 [Psora testacea]
MSNSSRDEPEAPPPPPAPPLPLTLPPDSDTSPAKDALTRIAAQAADRPGSSSSRRQNSHESRQPGLSNLESSKRSELPLLSQIWKPLYTPKVPQRESSLLKQLISRIYPPKVTRGTPANVLTPSPAVLRNLTHKTGIPIASLDISPTRNHAVLAGRDILRIVQLTDHFTFTSCTETHNLRSDITAYAATQETPKEQGSARQRDQLAASDVKWSHGSFDKKIATAAAHGQIVVYDVDRASLEWARLHEHNRQVHRLGFNPFGGYLMLSGSQDATIRMWDLRDYAGDKSIMTIFSRKRFPGNSDAVRDLRWSPTNAMEFAAATDSGVIQRWDIRKENAPLLKISAHEKACQTVDWHPDGKHLVSAGADKNVKVWDFSSSDRRMKTVWQLRAPQAVMHARWRPACWHAGDNRPGRWQSTQLATSFDKEDPRILIWDFRRPSVPFRIFNRYDDPPSALLWHSENLLWSVGSHGIFTQTDIRSLPKMSYKLNPNTLAWAPDGTLFVASMPRELRRSSLDDVNHEVLHQHSRRRGSSMSGSNSVETGSSEDPSPLSSSLKDRPSKHGGSPRASTSIDSTPPTAASGEPITPLDRSLLNKNIYKSGQVLGFCKIQSDLDIEAFKFLATHYNAPLPRRGSRTQASTLGNNLHLIFSETLQHNARVAAYASQYRMAQTWDMMAIAAQKELKKRADFNYRQRQLAAAADAASDRATSPTPSSDIRYNDQISLHTMSSDGDKGGLRPTSTMQPTFDTSSNITTPLAKPVSETPSQLSGSTAVPEVPLAEQLQLPDPTFPKQDPTLAIDIPDLDNLANPDSKKGASHDVRVISTTNSEYTPFKPKQLASLTTQLAGIDQEIAQHVATAQNYRGVPRPILAYGDAVPIRGTDSNVPTLLRRDSDDSFQLFSASKESLRNTQSDTGSFGSIDDSIEAGSTSEQCSSFAQPSFGNERRDSGHAFNFQDVEHSDNEENPILTGLEKLSSLDSPRSELLLERKDTATPRRLPVSSRPVDNPPAIVCYEDMEPFGEDLSPGDFPNGEEGDYILSDFDRLPPSDSDPTPLPWTLTAMLGPLIKYHVESLKDLQFPTYCFLHICPYFDSSDDMYNIHNVRLNIINQYYEQLRRHELYVEACDLRKYAEKDYFEFVERVSHGMDSGGAWCTNCNRPNKGNKPGYCERCKKAWAPCPICLDQGAIIQPRTVGVDTIDSRAVIYPDAADRLWTWCQQCGHGGHVGCMTEFWKDEVASEGACPVIGCLCDCMPGIRRDEINKQLEEEEEEEKKNKKGPVRPDGWVAGESAAVKGARGLTGGRGILQGGRVGDEVGGEPQMLSTLGRSVSGSKKVRIVEPGDEVRGEARQGEEGEVWMAEGKKKA